MKQVLFKEDLLEKSNKQVKIGEIQAKDISLTHATAQGWSSIMKVFSAVEQINENTNIFGLFDGHGGYEIAKIVSGKIFSFIKESCYFGSNQFEKALVDGFQLMDQWLLSPEGLKTIIEETAQDNWEKILSTEEINEKKSVKFSKKHHEFSSIELGLREYSNIFDIYPSNQKFNLIAKTIARTCGCSGFIGLITPQKVYCAILGNISGFSVTEKGVKALKDYNQCGEYITTICNQQILQNHFWDKKSKMFGSFSQKEINNQPTVPFIQIFDRETLNFLIIGNSAVWQTQLDGGDSLAKFSYVSLKSNKYDAALINKVFHQMIAAKIEENLTNGIDNLGLIMLCLTYDKNNKEKPENNIKLWKARKTITKNKIKKK